ncbi:metal-sensing transcriptional repressor [Comamonas sp. B-9]|uniref:metal-sensing transcriptional repressor n=1 Tax=Comamonas sp. B-9 TaxID=1055192 RepID=UPI00039577CC|nr:metal-sensing transcriptional repressor [Comamonas sp. B-9]
MSAKHVHDSHPKMIARLKRANGHLSSVIKMLEDERSCVDIAQQLFAVEKAIQQAKKVLIQDHIDHCLEHAMEDGDGVERIAEFKEITRYL